MSAARLLGLGQRQASIRLEHLGSQRGDTQAAHGEPHARRGQLGAAQLRRLGKRVRRRGAVFDDDAIGVAGIRGVGGERREHHQRGRECTAMQRRSPALAVE